MHLAEEARYQEGVFSRQQALGSGMSAQQVRRRLVTGSWTKVANNVYADSGLKMTTAAWRWAAVLSCGPEAVLSHRSAAEMWGMPVAPPNRPEITVAHHARVRPGPQVMVHSAAMDASDVAGLRGIALTSQRRTVLDCLLILPTNQGRSLLDRALQQGWVQLPALATAVREACGRPGVARARAVLIGADPTTASEAEKVAQALLSRAGITGWVSGFKLFVDGHAVAILDLAFPDLLLAIEIDGFAWHSDPERFQRDRHRQNALRAAGWMVLRFTWADLIERPGYVLATVLAAMAQRAG